MTSLQFVSSTVLAWMLTTLFQMQLTPSLSVMLQACSPGGMTSNIVALYAEGIVELRWEPFVMRVLLSEGQASIALYKITKERNDLNIFFEREKTEA